MSGRDSLQKVQMLRHSLRCFGFGIAGLIPVVGIPFALIGLVYSLKTRPLQKHHWNAARPYLIWGSAFCFLGILSAVVLAGIVAYRIFITELFGL